MFYLCTIFIKKKKNPSGIVSVQVIDKRHGKYCVIKTIGSSFEKITIDELCRKGEQWICNYKVEIDIFKQSTIEQEGKKVTEYLLSNIENVLINGTQLILDKVFKNIGFDAIANGMSFFLMFCIFLALLSILMFDFFVKVLFFFTEFHNFQN